MHWDGNCVNDSSPVCGGRAAQLISWPFLRSRQAVSSPFRALLSSFLPDFLAAGAHRLSHTDSGLSERRQACYFLPWAVLAEGDEANGVKLEDAYVVVRAAWKAIDDAAQAAERGIGDDDAVEAAIRRRV